MSIHMQQLIVIERHHSVMKFCDDVETFEVIFLRQAGAGFCSPTRRAPGQFYALMVAISGRR
jgi:hypothetical protein